MAGAIQRNLAGHSGVLGDPQRTACRNWQRYHCPAALYCDYGYNIRVGADVFLNFDCVILDVVSVVIGDGAQIGPTVQIYAADHPRDPEARRAGLEFGRPINIGRNAWIGGGAILLPGVSVGDNAVVGAGSVVTRNVLAGATVAGNPARMLANRRPANGPR